MRLFIGLELPPQMRKAAREASEQYRRLAPGRYGEAELFHLTLAFLGERNPHQLAPLEELLKKIAGDFHPFRLALSRPGHFARPENAILYLGVEGEEFLRPLSDRLRAELSRAEQPFDPKPFQAHITLARKVRLPAGAALPCQFLPAPRPAEGEFSHLTLFHSTRVENALRYLPIFRASFGDKS